MNKGKIVYLNGVTSFGKTSIIEEIQARDDLFFYVLSNDFFEQMIGERHKMNNYSKYWSELVIMMYHTAKLYSDMGKNVLIDGMLSERREIRPHYKRLLEILKDNPLEVVEIFCPLERCMQRNIERGNRYADQSLLQNRIMAKDINYSLKVDTSKYSPAECAIIIWNELFKE